MTDESKKMFDRINALSKQAQNYRYAGAYQRLEELKQFMDARTKQTQQPAK